MVVETILKLTNAQKITELISRPNYDSSIFSEDSVLKLINERHQTLKPIVKSPR